MWVGFNINVAAIFIIELSWAGRLYVEPPANRPVKKTLRLSVARRSWRYS